MLKASPLSMMPSNSHTTPMEVVRLFFAVKIIWTPTLNVQKCPPSPEPLPHLGVGECRPPPPPQVLNKTSGPKISGPGWGRDHSRPPFPSPSSSVPRPATPTPPPPPSPSSTSGAAAGPPSRRCSWLTSRPLVVLPAPPP